MRRLLLHTVTVWALCATGASAAEVRTEDACHRVGTEVRLGGTGFSPGAAYAITMGGETLETGVVDEAGRVAASIAAPSLRGDAIRDRVRVRVADATGVAAEAGVLVTRTTARVTPRRVGDPRRARVRFAVFGMGERRPSVYLHTVDPRGRVRSSVRLGRARGACGDLTSRRRTLLPFAPIRGTWRLQLDTRRTYRRTTRPRVVQPVRIVRRR